MDHLHDHALTPAARWATHPCANPVAHRPRPVSTSGHHALWQWAQRRVHQGAVPDTTLIWLCDNCHVAVHAYGEAILLGLPPPRVSPFLRRIAQIGVDYVRAHHLPPPYPPPLVPGE